MGFTGAIVVAMAVDALLGWPSQLFARLGHPVTWLGRLIVAIDTGWIPATMNHEEADPDCGLDIVPNQARQTNPRIILNNAYAFGGNNACLCLRRFEA